MPLSTKLVASGLKMPVLATAPSGDTKRLFLAERGDKRQPGRIKILNLETGKIHQNPFLAITEISSDFNEQGLLGMAFHPKFADNGFFYVNFTQHPGQDPHRLITHIRRYKVSTNDPDVVDPTSATTILTIPQPFPAEQFKNHKCGWLGFGPKDGFLYIGTGDGGPLSGNDPNGNAQNLGVLLGKILRIDIDRDDFPSDPNLNYAIPPDNPFVNRVGAKPEIWAFGLRNPWRNCFDRKTSDLYIADVGQGEREEINFQSAASSGGENYGWRIMEGTRITGLNPVPPVGTLKAPIFEYSHASGERAIIGGFVYRGTAIAGLDGTYFFADITGTVSSFKFNGTIPLMVTPRGDELFPDGIENINSFGEDAIGELYICVADGRIFRITGTVP
jgi:glucose/arabinose dehydrogenase